MKNFLTFISFFIGVMGLASCQDDQYKISIDEFQSAVLEDSTVLIDVRTPEEFEVARIPGAINIDVKSDSFSIKIKSLDKSLPFYLYCRSGVRSNRAAEKMSEEGFERIHDLQDGILGWREEGLSIDSARLDISQ